mgnify:CR=1 FL=1
MRSLSCGPDARRRGQPCLSRSPRGGPEVCCRATLAALVYLARKREREKERKGDSVMLARRVAEDDEEVALFWWRNARHTGTWAACRYRSFGFRLETAVARPGRTTEAPRLSCWYPRATCPGGDTRGSVGEFIQVSCSRLSRAYSTLRLWGCSRGMIRSRWDYSGLLGGLEPTTEGGDIFGVDLSLFGI